MGNQVFNVGDRVLHRRIESWGEGVVIRVDQSNYPVRVLWENGLRKWHAHEDLINLERVHERGE